MPEERLLKQGGKGEDRDATEHVVPEVADIRGVKENQDERLRSERGDEDGRAANKAEKKCDQKDSENTAIKDRTENVDRLDQVLEEVGEKRERDGDSCPRRP